MLEKLKAEYPTDWQERIERLSEYMASTGKSYKSHLATVRAWARKEGDRQKQAPTFESRKGSYFQPQAKSISYAEYQAAAVAVDNEDEDEKALMDLLRGKSDSNQERRKNGQSII